MKSLPAYITRLREGRGMDKKTLAALAGVDASILSRFESGQKDIRAKTLRALLGALGIAPGSAGYIEAFALQAADSALSDRVGAPTAKTTISKRITSAKDARANEEHSVINLYRTLSAGQRDTIQMLLENPAAIDGLNAMLYARLPASRKKS